MYSDRHSVFDKITFTFAHESDCMHECGCWALALHHVFVYKCKYVFFSTIHRSCEKERNDEWRSCQLDMLVWYAWIVIKRKFATHSTFAIERYCPAKLALKSIANHVRWTSSNRFVYIKQRVVNNWIKPNLFNAYMPIFIRLFP